MSEKQIHEEVRTTSFCPSPVRPGFCRGIQDFIYKKSQERKSFNGILEAACNEVTIITALIMVPQINEQQEE
jgi:hypothetical protein